MSNQPEDELEIPQNFSKVLLGLFVGVVVIGIVVWAGYNMKKGSQTVLPSGFVATTPSAPAPSLNNTDCAKLTKPDPRNVWPYYIKCSPYKVSADTKWKTYTDPKGFSFDTPDTLKLATYPNGVGFNYNEIPAQANLLYSLDLSSSRSGEFKNMDLTNYPKNYWRQFSGLTSTKDVFDFTNSKNVKAVRAVYVNINQESPATDVFFEFPNQKGDFVHFGSGVLDSSVFNTIIDSFKFAQ